MPRIRHCRARDLNHGDRFARTVAEELRHGLHWPDYRHALSE